MPHKPTAVALTVFQVILRDRLDAERLLDGRTLVETKGGQIIISTVDPDAAEKLAGHPAVLGFKRVGRAAMVTEWTGALEGVGD
jgi:hypothetical protein